MAVNFGEGVDRSRWDLVGPVDYGLVDEFLGGVFLTSPLNGQLGYLFSKQLINTQWFNVTFSFSTVVGSRGEGFAFVLSRGIPTDADAQRATGGGAFGFDVLDGIAIEFDTRPGDRGDPSLEHVGLDVMPSGDALAAQEVTFSLRDKGPYDVWIAFDSGRIRVHVGNPPVGLAKTLVLDYTIPDFVPFDGYFGFVGATGDGTDAYVILDVIFDDLTAPTSLVPPTQDVIFDDLAAPTSLVPPTLAGALALIRGFPGLGAEPPQVADASIAVGPRSVIVSTNVGFGMYTKTGERIAGYRLHEFFRGLFGLGRGLTDPRAIFDAPSQRFFLLAHAGPAIRDCVPGTCKNEYLFAVSKSASPSSLDPSDWHRYVFDGTLESDGPANWWGDFGTVGTNSTLLVLPVIGTRDHDSPKQGPQYTKLFVFDKRALLRGDKVDAPLAIFSGESDAQRMTKVVAAVTFGDPDTVFAVEGARGGRCSVTVFGISGPPDAPTLLRHTAAVAGECDHAPHAPQRGGGAPLDAGFIMSSQPVYRDGYLWLVQPVRVSFPSGPTSGVRLVQIDVRNWPGPPRIVYDETFSEEAVWYLYPALTVSAEGHIAIVTVRVGPNDYASVYYTGRLASDSPGTFRTLAALKLGTANQAGTPVTRESGTYQRFADFSGAALDPSDGTAWVIGVYVDGPCSWGTWVGNISWTIVDQTVGTMPSLPAPSPPEPAC